MPFKGKSVAFLFLHTFYCQEFFDPPPPFQELLLQIFLKGRSPRSRRRILFLPAHKKEREEFSSSNRAWNIHLCLVKISPIHKWSTVQNAFASINHWRLWNGKRRKAPELISRSFFQPKIDCSNDSQKEGPFYNDNDQKDTSSFCAGGRKYYAFCLGRRRRRKEKDELLFVRAPRAHGKSVQ